MIAKQRGASIFSNQQVLEINEENSKYHIRTKKIKVIANNLILALPPVALKNLKGNVIEALEQDSHFQSIGLTRVATVTQWFPTNWWKDFNVTSSGRPVFWFQTGNCLTQTEIPIEDHMQNEKVIRSAYTDREECIEELSQFEKNGILAEQVHMMLTEGVAKSTVTSKVYVPQPVETHLKVWDPAWHFIKAGFGYSNQDIVDWAAKPYCSKNIGLVGDAYYPDITGWSIAAIRSAKNHLISRYGLEI